MKPVVALDIEDLREIERILRNGLHGTHLLFSNGMIREAFDGPASPPEQAPDTAGEVQTALAEILRCQDLEQRQDAIASLHPRVRATLVHLYFDLLDRYLTDGRGPEVLN